MSAMPNSVFFPLHIEKRPAIPFYLIVTVETLFRTREDRLFLVYHGRGAYDKRPSTRRRMHQQGEIACPNA
jgi:hypothetical protein